jgi:hypothetical protein
VEQAILFKSGLNYLYVGESGLVAHSCERTYNGNEIHNGYNAQNYRWEWAEIGRLTLVYRDQFYVSGSRGHPVLFAWPAPGLLPGPHDEHQRAPQPSHVNHYAFLDDHSPGRAKAWLTGVRRQRRGREDFLRDFLWQLEFGVWDHREKSREKENWRYLVSLHEEEAQGDAWEVCAAPLFRRRRWRRIARAIHQYSAGRVELDASPAVWRALDAVHRSIPPGPCAATSWHAGKWVVCEREGKHRGRHRTDTGHRFIFSRKYALTGSLRLVLAGEGQSCRPRSSGTPKRDWNEGFGALAGIPGDRARWTLVAWFCTFRLMGVYRVRYTADSVPVAASG